MPKTEYEKIFIQPGTSKSSCQIFVFDLPAEPDEFSAAESEPERRIFGILEIESQPNRKITAFINSLLSEIKNFRYMGEEKSAEFIFEKLVQKINYKYLDLVGNKSAFGDGETPVPKINALLALEEGKNIYLTQRGRIFPFLIYQARPQTYKIIDISETASGKEGRGSINLFTNIISGKINIDDYLFICTESLLDYFSLEKICKTASESDPGKAAENFNNLLAEAANPKTSFAALILKLKNDTVAEKVPAPPKDEQEKISMPQNSMAVLMKTAHNTEKMLTPSLRLNLGSKISSFFQNLKVSREEKKQIKDKARLEYYSSQFTPPSRAGKILKPIAWLFLAIFRTIYLIFKTIIVSFFGIFPAIFNFVTGKKRVAKNPAEEMPSAPGQIAELPKPQAKKVPISAKALLIFAAVILCLFAAGTAYLYFKYEKEAVVEALSQKIETIQNKKDAAEASLIYNDEVGAKKLLDEAEELLVVFPQSTDQEKSAYEKISEELGALRQKIRHAANIENPALVVNFSEHNPSAAVNEFIVSANNLYAFDRLASAVYKINLETKEIINKNAPGLSLRLGFLENDDSALFYQPERKFFKFNLTDDVLRELEVTLNENESKVDDLALYNQKLYILDSGNNQIFRHIQAEAGYSRGTPWIKDGTDVKNSVSFAIDGSIYLATGNGEIIKFTNGEKDDFSVSVDPAIASPTKVWTSPESSYVYILEPAGKRLVVINKDGKLKIQYISEQFSDLRDFVVMEKEKKIYLLSGNEIYGIVAEHLQ